MKKRILSLLLCVLMVLALFPLTVWAEDTYEIADDGALTKNGEALPIGTVLEAGTVVTVKNTVEDEVTLTVLKLDGVEKASVTGPAGEQTVTFETAVQYQGVLPVPGDSVTENVSYFVTYVEEEPMVEEVAALEKEAEPLLEGTETLEKEESEKPAEEATEPTEEVTEPAEEVTEPAEEAAEPAEEAAEPVEEVAEPAEEATEPVEEAVEPEEEATEPALMGKDAPDTHTFTIAVIPNNGGLDKDKTLTVSLPLDDEGKGAYTVPTNVVTAPEGKELDEWTLEAHFVLQGEEDTIRYGVAPGKEIYLFEDFYDISLKAQWKGAGTHKVSYYDFPYSDYTERTDEFYAEGKLPQVLPTRTSDAFTFIGWSWNDDNYGKLATPGMEFSGDLSLCGVWSYNVHYVANGGTGSMQDEVISFTADDFDAPECGFTAPKGKVFAGWKVKAALLDEEKSFIAQPGEPLVIEGFYYGHLTLTAQWNDRYIHSVDAAVVEPTAGAKPDFEVDFTGDPADVLRAEEGDYEVKWYVRCGKEWKPMGKDDLFESGKTYAVDIFVACESDYRFSKFTVATLNGKYHNYRRGASYSEDKPGELTISGEWTVGKAKEDIFTVMIAVDTPLAGKIPDKEAEVEFNYRDDTACKQKAKATWYLETQFGPIEMNEKAVFEAGKTYSVTVEIKAPDGYKFCEDSFVFLDNQGMDDVYDAVDPTVITATRFWELPKVSPTLVTNVTANITEPVIGAHPDFEPAVSVTPDGGAALSEIGKSTMWAVYDTKTMELLDYMDPTDVFESGKTYRLSVSFGITEGYAFDPAITGTVNGKDCEDIYSPFLPGFAVLDYYWTLSEKTPITWIKATVTEPVIGSKPSPFAFVLTVPYNAVSCEDVEVVWYVSDTNGKKSGDWVKMGKNETFAPGKYYSADLFIKAKEGYTFSDKIIGCVNGYFHDGTFGAVYDATKPTEAYLSHVWYLDEVKISHVAAKVAAPVVGKTPSYRVTATSVPSKALEEVNALYVDWYVYDAKTSTWKLISPTTTFKENRIYRVDMYIEAKDGYVFSKKVKGTINGEAHNAKAPIYDPSCPTEICLSYIWRSADEYAITGDEIWVKGDSHGMVFTSDASVKKFKEVRVDGVKVSAKNYTVEKGSTVVTLKPAYLDTLSIGFHTVTIISTDGKATMTFEVIDRCCCHCDHCRTTVIGQKDATCTEKGYTGDVVCKKCGRVLEKGKSVAALGHWFVNGKCKVCGARKGEANPDTGASTLSLAAAVLLAGGAALVAFKKRK